MISLDIKMILCRLAQEFPNLETSFNMSTSYYNKQQLLTITVMVYKEGVKVTPYRMSKQFDLYSIDSRIEAEVDLYKSTIEIINELKEYINK